MLQTWGGAEVAAARTKWNAALAIPPEEILQVLERPPGAYEQVDVDVLKRETGKVRHVVAGDLWNYLIQASLQWVDDALKGHPSSTLFMSSRQQNTMWEQLARDAGDPRMIKVPLDQSHFDWQQSKRMLATFLDAMRDWISRSASERLRGPLLSALKRARAGIVGPGRVLYRDGDGGVHSIRITKGVASGWRWTALIDTVLNYGIFRAMQMALERLRWHSSVVGLIAQGDDDEVRVTSWGGAVCLSVMYKMANFEVNPKKTFFSNDRDEFLRQVITSSDVSGYPARAVTARLWRNPVSDEQPKGLLRLREVVAGYGTLIGRGVDRELALRECVIDAAAGNDITQEQVRRLLTTPAALGGLGALQWRGEDLLAVEEGRVEPRFTPLVKDRQLKWAMSRLSRLGIAIPVGTLKAALTANLIGAGLPVKIVYGKVVDVDRAPVRLPKPWSTGIRLFSRHNAQLPKAFASTALEFAIRERQFEWIRNVWVDERDRLLARTVEKRGGRRVWFAWLRGKLPFTTPICMGWSALRVSAIYTQLAEGAWNELLSRSRFSWTSVIKAAMAAETWTWVQLAHLHVHYGG
jgi:hypothetical protein